MGVVYGMEVDVKAAKAYATFKKIEQWLDRVESKFNKVRATAKKFGANLFANLKTNALASGMSGLEGVLRAVGRFSLTVASNFVGINSEMELMRAQLTTIEGSAVAGEKSFQHMLELVTRMPFSLDSVVNSFAKFKAAGLQDAVGWVTTLGDAIAAFGGTSENFKLASVAIQQMVGKGVISMEEMRRQLSEQIPTAFAIMADKADMSVGELVETISSGKAESQKFLALLKEGFDETYGGAGARMMETFSGSVIKVKNEWTKLMLAIGDGRGSFKSLKDVVSSVADALGEFRKSAKGMEIIDRISSSLKNFFDTYANAETLAKALTNISDGISLVIQKIQQLNSLVVNSVDTMTSLWKFSKLFNKTGLVPLPDANAVVDNLKDLPNRWNAMWASMKENFKDKEGFTFSLSSITNYMKDATNILSGDLPKQEVAITTEQAYAALEKLKQRTLALNRAEMRNALQGYSDSVKNAMDKVAEKLTKAAIEVVKLKQELWDLRGSLTDERFKLTLSLETDEASNVLIRNEIDRLMESAAKIDLSGDGGLEKQLSLLERAKGLISNLSDTSRKVTKEDVDDARDKYIKMQNEVARHNVSSKRAAMDEAFKDLSALEQKLKDGATLGDDKAIDKEKLEIFDKISAKILENKEAEVAAAAEKRDALQKNFDTYKELYLYLNDQLNLFDSELQLSNQAWGEQLTTIEQKYKDIFAAASKTTSIKEDKDIAKTAGARALGGPVTRDKTYLVGERGPELFTPSSSGNIIPNNKLKSGKGSSVDINLNMGGQQVQLNGTRENVDLFIDGLQRAQRLAA